MLAGPDTCLPLARHTYLHHGSWAIYTDGMHYMCHALSELLDTAGVSTLRIMEEAQGTESYNYHRPHGSLICY